MVATARIAVEHGSFDRICQVDPWLTTASLPQTASRLVQPVCAAHCRELTDGQTDGQTDRRTDDMRSQDRQL